MFLGIKMKTPIKESGFKFCDGVYYGYIENYLVSISYHSKSYELFVEIPVYSFSRDLYDSIKDYIHERTDESRITAYSINSSGISLFFNPVSFKKMISFMSEFLAELGPCPDIIRTICGNCGNNVTDEGKYVRTGYHVHHVDNECAMILKNNPAEKTPASAKGHPISGMVGAVLFGLIALSGYLFAAYRGYLCSWILFFIPVLLMYGFMLFGGKPSGFMAALIIVIPVMFFVISLAGLLSAEIGIRWYSDGYTFTVGQLLSYSENYFRTEIGSNNPFISGQVYTGVLFLLLGIAFSLTFSFKLRHISNVRIIEEKIA